MAEYLTPGQYVVEEEPKIKVAETLSSSIGCLIGKFNKGELGKPVLVSGWSEFKKLFGNDDLVAVDSAYSFFEQGGTRLYVIRVGDSVNNVSANAVFTATPNIKFVAKSGGTWANNYKVYLTKKAINTCTLREAISSATKILKVSFVDSWKVGQRVFDGSTCLGKVVATTVTQEGLELTIDTDVSSLTINKTLTAESVDIVVKNNSETVTEEHKGLALEKGLENYWLTVVNRDSSFINIVITGTIASDKELASLHGGSAGIFTLTSGTTQAVATNDYTTAITDVLPVIDSMANVFVVPESSITSGDLQEIFNKLFLQATISKRFFALSFIPVASETDVSAMVSFRNGLNSNEYGALWQGYIPVYNETKKDNVMTPPVGAMAGVMARLAREKGYWLAPAGLQAQIMGINRVSKSVSDVEQASLNPIGINCLRVFTGVGILPWGARLLSTSSSMKYITDRITFNVVEQTILKNNLWSVFRPNDTQLWESLGISINEFLRAEWRKGALRGVSESEAFLVKYGSEVTDWYDVQTGKCHIVIGLATQKPAEFIIYHVYPIVGQ